MIVFQKYTGYQELIIDDGWEKQPALTVKAPEFIKLRSQGKAKIIDGRVYIKREEQ